MTERAVCALALPPVAAFRMFGSVWGFRRALEGRCRISPESPTLHSDAARKGDDP